MQRHQILIDLDREIAKLEQAKAILVTLDARPPIFSAVTKRKPGRPTGSGKLSAEGRRHIAEAMKRSWALRRQARAA